MIGVAVTKRRHDEGKPWAEQEQGKGVAESVKINRYRLLRKTKLCHPQIQLYS